MFDAPGEQAHHWHEGGTAPEGVRLVSDEHGNMVAWNSETGEVVTAMREHDPQHPDDSVYETSQTNEQHDAEGLTASFDITARS